MRTLNATWPNKPTAFDADGGRARILPRFARRPIRFVQRLVRGDIEIPKHTERYGIVGVIGAFALYGSVVGGQFAQGVEATTASMGFAVREIEITGNTFTKPEDVFLALGLNGNRSLISIDVAHSRQALSAMPWIDSVSIRKAYPDTLVIDVVERAPYALWQMGDAIAVIETDGETIGGYAADPRLTSLPLLVGVGANEAGKAFIEEVAQFPDIANRVHAYIRVGDRRWDIRLENGLTVRLPEAGVDHALGRLLAMDAQLGVTHRDLAAIDLRLKDRTVFAMTENSAKTRAEFVKSRAEAHAKAIKGSSI